MSEARNVNYGFPQVPFLGPILFGKYVNDFPGHVSGLIVQRVVDITLLHTGTVGNIHQLIKDTETILKQYERYFLSNDLLLNPRKTQWNFLGSRPLLANIPPSTILHFDGETILPSNQIKILGVHIDRYMLFDVHLNELQKKVTG